MNKRTFILVTRVSLYLIATAVVAYVVFANTTPFDVVARYTNTDKTVSTLSPPTRIETATVHGVEVTKQVDDLIYFSTKLPTSFEKAHVKITFLNGSPDQELEVGFKDKSQWHYNTQVVDNPLFHRSDLTYIGTGTVLYTTKASASAYSSAADFLRNPPAGATTGTLDYALKDTEPVLLPGYFPAQKDTVLSTPLRGSHTLYAYVENEPFRMSITKQDLNWYNDPDVMEVRIYKDDDLVFTVTYDDDGVADDSRRLGPKEVGEIKNPGPGLPEPGVYKIVIDANNDTLVTNITTNLHKIVFTGPLYPVSNASVYPGFVTTTNATTLYTNSARLAVVTHHGSALQTITMNDKPVSIDATDTSTVLSDSTSTPAISFSRPDISLGNGESTTSVTGDQLASTLTPQQGDAQGTLGIKLPALGGPPESTATTSTTKIVIPKSDMIVAGAGYFAFDPEQFFTPSMYTVVPIKAPEDINMVDYVVSPYEPPKVENGFMVVEREFDILSAVPKDGRLSWIIRAPGLKETGGEILIKDIEITYSKKGWASDE